MAEVTGLRNNALPYPIYGVPFGIVFPYFDADGDLVSAATTPDSEVSLNGDTFADCTNEATEIATTSGMWYLLLTAAEVTADVIAIISKSATSGMKTTPIVLYPRKLVTIRSGTSAGGAAGYITLDASASAVDDYYNGMVCIATIDGNVEARVISDYTGSNQQAAVVPNWNVVPDADDTFIIKLPEGVQINQANATHVNSTSQTAGDLAAMITTVDGVVDDILVDTGTTLEVDLDAIIAAVITNAAGTDIAADIIAVKADTAAILTDTGTTLEADLDAIIAAVITNAAGVDIAADIIAIKAETATILADTNELQTDDYPTSIAAVKADTAAILTDTGTTLDAALAVVDANVDAILVDTGTTLDAALAVVDANVDSILVDTAVIGAAGAGLTAIPWNAAWDAEVESEANDALVANNLDHVALTATGIPAIPAGTYIDQMMDDGTAVYDRATDSLQALRDNLATAAALDVVDNFLDTEVAAILAAVDTEVGDILTDTGTTIPAQISALNNLSAAQVNAEVVDALNVDTYAEPGQGAPAVTASLAAKIGYMYKAWRNKKTQTATERKLYADDGTTVDQKATDSDDTTTFTKGELGTGP